ncbi:MAG: hypothetical protein E7F31_02675 [Klebsiella pneumoniae]|nr:hypothetical protein [Klebsiella pneumoniae]MDU3470162.1 hypothetical protein [Klebsiella pneumoniae]MDU3529157.1 hypothetical protein [Klebsiella pneumoniae]
MTTDITELAQSLKAAANTTADAIDRLEAFPGDELIDLSQHEGEQVDIDITTLNEWYELSSPANVLALVEALEKAQQVDEELCKLLPPGVEYMDPPDGGDVTPLEGVRRMVADYRQLIAELESRTVKLPKPHAHLIWIQAGHAPDDYWDDVAVSHSEKDRCCDGSERYPVYARWEIEEMMSAAGIKVEAE